MSIPDTYQYRPLISADEIRLLLLQPGAPGSDMHCSLIHTTLPECHDDIYEHYTALSYVWGDASQKRVIFIDQRPFQITINLAAALDDLRHQHNMLRLWADAICVDQSNISERNHQVGLMRDIYSFAQHTIIYLGDSNDDCDQVMNAALQGPLSSRLRRLSVLQILSRPWFTRVWIYQELVLSKEPWIQCGRKRIRWNILHDALVVQDEKSHSSSKHRFGWETLRGAIFGHEDKKFQSEENIDNHATLDEVALIKRFSDMNSARRGQPQEPMLFSVMLNRRGFRATDLRDLVYGHLAVARLPSKENSPPCPVVDYRQSVVEVFTDATSYMLKETQSNEVLLHTSICNPTCRLKGLPSWVPDWSLDSSQYIKPLPGFRRQLSVPSNNQLKFLPLRSLFKPAVVLRNICILRCLRIDTVKATSNVIPQMQATPELRSEIYEEIKRNGGDRFWCSSSPLLLSVYCGLYQTLQRVLGGNFLDTLPEQSQDLFHQGKYQNIWSSITEDNVPNEIEGFLVRHAIGMTSPWNLTNRKIGVVGGGALGILPPATQPGDEIYAVGLHHSRKYPGRVVDLHQLVLRPYLINSAIDAETPEYETTRDDDGGWGNTRHFTLVGCAWIGALASSYPSLFLDGYSGPDSGFKEQPQPKDRRTTAWIH